MDDFFIDQIYRAVDQTLRGEAQPMEALAEAQTLCQAKLDEVMEDT